MVDWGQLQEVEAEAEAPLRGMLFCSHQRRFVLLVLLSSFLCVRLSEEVVAEEQEAQIGRHCNCTDRTHCRSRPRFQFVMLARGVGAAQKEHSEEKA